MAARISWLVFVTRLLLEPRTRGCMQVDLCAPERVEHHPLHQGAREDGAVFRLSAFRRDFYLHLAPDSSFVGARSIPPREEGGLRGCFYSGTVNADPDSFAALSLCKGLQGGFSYQGMEYFISRIVAGGPAAPSERGHSLDKTHVIRRRSRAAHPGSESGSRCGVPDSNLSLPLDHKHLRATGGWTDAVLRSLGRSKRFASVPRFVEVLVVADQTMAKFHGDDLKHYLLTLMSVAARLYKHPSILNSISIVVVGFMVVSDADAGPKVSSNAALSLRNFCAWQSKFNQASDKHPEHWDTAILFTRLVGSD